MAELCICANSPAGVDLCVDGTVYGFCEDESCGGMCAPYGKCLCLKCHPKVARA